MIEINKIYLEDCLIKLPEIDNESIDMILCDLPYGGTQNKWDIIIPFKPLWEQYERIIKKNGAIVLTASQPFTSLLVTSNLKLFRYELVWRKNKFSNFLDANRKPLKQHENILVFYKKLPIYNPQYTISKPYERWNTNKSVENQTNYGKHKPNHPKSDGKRYPISVLDFDREERPLHPTQKPVELFKYLIKTYSNEGDLILDNASGVGTTGISCLETNRNYILIEKEKKFYDISIERIKKWHENKKNIFDII